MSADAAGPRHVPRAQDRRNATIREGNAMHRLVLPICAALAGLAGCATDIAQRDADKEAMYRAHAGAPVDKFRYFGSINSWTPLGDEAIAVWTRPNEAYLLEFTGPCQEIQFTPAISITNTFGQVAVPFDKVIVHSRSSVTVPCHIARIRPLDVKALKAARRAQDASAQEASGEGPASGT
jgi:hypothetical protein